MNNLARKKILCSRYSIEKKELYKSILVIGLAIFFAIHNFIRMFDNSVWGDEGIVVGLVRVSWGNMLAGVAANGHSPFHYAFAWICVRLFGESGLVFHFSASLPYFIILILAVTVIRKWFGNKTAVLFITLASLLNCAVTYNMEIRMYVWCELFILLSFLTLYKIYQTQEIKYYFLMTLFGTAGAYSHYFALASIGIMYAVLLIYVCLREKKRIVATLISGGAILGLLAPWLLYAHRVGGAVISNYSLGQVSWSECIEFIFYSKISWLLLVVFLFTIVLLFLYEYKAICLKSVDEGKTCVKIQRGIYKKLSAEWMWVFSGILAVFGTIVAAEIISHLLYPIICLRYLYVSYVIIWLLMGYGIPRLKHGRIWTAILLVIIFCSCYPSLLDTIRTELDNNRRLENTLEVTQPIIDSDDYIYTNIVHFAWTVADAYYPKIAHNLFGHSEWWGSADLSELDSNVQYWLFLSKPITDDISQCLNEQSKTTELIVDNGYIGTGNVWVYKVINN